MRYSDELLDEIRSRNDIVDIVSQYVKLKRSGRNFMGLCPFHNEKSPSMSVSPDKQIFHCFGCGVGGNVFHFISKVENISFVEAVQLLAERAGIKLPTDNNAEDEKRLKLKARLYDLNKETAEFYHENLYKPTAKPAQEYVKKRKLDNNTLKTFKIGYSGKFNELYEHLKKKGFTEEEMLMSGLIKRAREPGKFYDAYRNRVMFPIMDTRERVIAFGGRVLDDSKPKYVNSPENAVYSKSRNLYALNVAKRYSPKEIIIVEGYMDAISLHQRGIHNVVASLGTALTEMQGRLLRRTSEKVIIGYDADGAGQTATLRGLEILQNLGTDIRILQLDREAKDPDEYVTKYGPDFFRACVEKAISLVEFKVKMLKKELNLDVVNDKIKFLNEIAKVLAKVDNKMEQEIYIDKIANEYKVSKDAIYSEIKKLLYKDSDNNNKKIDNANKQIRNIIEEKEKSEKKIDEKTLRREKLIIYLLINHNRETYERLKNNITPDMILSDVNKSIIEKIYAKSELGQVNAEDILNWFEEENILNYLSEIMATDFEIDKVDKCVDEVIQEYEKEKLINRRNEILKMLEGHSSGEETANLEKELNEIIIKLARIK